MSKPDPRCHINYKHKYVFINMSKNASTSLRHAIVFDSMSNYDTIDNPEDYLKFVVLRNPIYRVISSFLEVIKLRRDGPYQITENSDWFKEEDLEKKFTMFLDFIDGNFYDSHVTPQIKFLTAKGLTIDDIDFKLIHSNLNDDYDKLISTYPQIKTKSALSKLQVGTSGVKDKLTNIVESNENIRTRIREIYSEDFDLYDKIFRIK